MKNKALIILGPTGVGKSELAIKVAKLFDGEIISADSVQIYRGLDIGSGKVTKGEMEGIKHHCIDILPPESEFSVYEFVEKTKKLIEQISSRSHLPIIVGGTALYTKALTEGYDFGGSGKQSKLREQLSLLTNEQLKAKLSALNPQRAGEIELNDRKKLIRAIEIATFGENPSKKEVNIDFLSVALVRERQELYDRINARVDKMLAQGLENEVKGLKDRGLSSQNQSMQAIGYKEMLSYLNGEISLSEAVELMKRHSRNYAKRQMTFLRGMKIEMFEPKDEQILIKKIGEWYENR